MNIIPAIDLVLSDIVIALRAGQTFVYPTETCYGLGCDATNTKAVARVFEIKQRQEDKPVLVVMADIDMAMRSIKWNGTIEKLARRFWPGALTIVAYPKVPHGFGEGILGPRGMVAFRVTSHPIAASLCRAIAAPLVSTSANIASRESPYAIEEVIRMFEHTAHQPDVIIDAGELSHHSPSTIVRVAGDSIEVLRQGEVVVK